MAARVLFACLVAGALAVSLPRGAWASKADREYKQAIRDLRKGNLQGAESGFEAILMKKPGDRPAQIMLGVTYFMLGEQAEKKKQRALAVSEIQKALRLQPDEAYFHSELSKLLGAEGKVQEAQKECAAAAKLSPDDSYLTSGCGLGNGRASGSQTGHALKAGGEVEAPRPRYAPAPAYSEKARMVGYQGTVVVGVLVNAKGRITDMRIVKAVGLGLDQQALRTLRTWKFKPAMRNGVPVSVRIMVELAFRLRQ